MRPGSPRSERSSRACVCARAVVEVWEHGAGLAGQSSPGREAELGSLVQSTHGEQWDGGWLPPPPPGPGWKVPRTGRFHLPCLMFHGKWAPFYQKEPSQPLLIHRTHPNCSRTHIEKTGRGIQGPDTQGGVFPAVPALPPDIAPKHGVRLGTRRPRAWSLLRGLPPSPICTVAEPSRVWFLHLYLPRLTYTFLSLLAGEAEPPHLAPCPSLFCLDLSWTIAKPIAPASQQLLVVRFLLMSPFATCVTSG